MAVALSLLLHRCSFWISLLLTYLMKTVFFMMPQGIHQWQFRYWIGVIPVFRLNRLVKLLLS